MKKLMSIILTLAMMLSMCVLTSAADSNSVSVNIGGKEVTVQALDSNCLLVTEGSEKSLITVSKEKNIVTATTKSISSGKETIFIRNYETGTLYSSMTGYTGVVQASADEPGTYYISFDELGKYLTVGVAAVEIIAFVSTHSGLPTVAGLAAGLGLVMGAINAGLAFLDEDSGLYYKTDYVTIHKQQGGHDFYVDVLKVVEIGVY